MSNNGVSANVALLVEKERKVNAELILNAIQIEHTIEAFNKRIVALINTKNNLKAAQTDIREELRKHRMMTDLCCLPPELTVYAAAIGGAVSCNALLMNINEDADQEGCNMVGGVVAPTVEDISSKRRGQYNLEFNECIRDQKYVPFPFGKTIPNGGISKEYIDKACTYTSVRYNPIHTLPQCSTQNAYCPVIAANGLLNRRPVTTDFSVCRAASKVEMGRTIVSKTFFEEGDLLFVDHAFFTVLERPDIILLMEPFDSLLTRVLSKGEVFDAQKWDRRLAIAAISYFAEIFDINTDETATRNVRENAHFIGCPIEAVDPEQLNSLCEFAKFLHAALPAYLYNLISEDDITAFFVSFQTNAILHGENSINPESTLLEEADIASLMVSGEVKRSLFSFLSLVEHSCDPNATVVIRRVTDCATGGYLAEIRAMRNIGVGEAVSIAYVSALPGTTQRRRTLRIRYFFECMCHRCTIGVDYSRTFLNNEDRMLVPVGDGTNWKIYENCRNENPTAVVVRYDDPCVLSLLSLEEGFIELTKQAMDGIGLIGESGEHGLFENWSYAAKCGKVLDEWSNSYKSGYLRLAPSHCAVVAQALLCSKCLLFALRKKASLLDSDLQKHEEVSSICVSVIEILRRYVVALARFCLGLESEEENQFVVWASGATIDKTMYLTPPTPPSISSQFQIFYTNVCLVPVLESFGVVMDNFASEEASINPKASDNICSGGKERVWYCVQWLLKNIGLQGGSEKHLKAQLKASALL